MAGGFDVDGLSGVIKEQIDYHNNSDTINLLWSGYLAALAVQGHISDEEYHRLKSSLKDVGRQELQHLFLGVPGQFE